MADTKWDKSRDLIEDALNATRQLEQSWPRIGDHFIDTGWAREIDRAIKSLQALRQAAVSGQDMELLQRIATTRRNLDDARTAGDQVWINAEQAILDSLQREPRR